MKKSKKEKSDPLLLYTDRLDQNFASIIRRIPAAAGSDQFFSAPKTSRSQVGATQWLAAWRIPETQEWMVDQHCLLPSDSKMLVITKTPVLGRVCFFDALYHCAHFERSEVALGAVGVPTVLIAGYTHYSTAAAASGQPLDIHFLPHPAARGNIMTGGQFTQEQSALAEKTATINLLHKDHIAGRVLTPLTRDLFERKNSSALDSAAALARDHADRSQEAAARQESDDAVYKKENKHMADALAHAWNVHYALQVAVNQKFIPEMMGGNKALTIITWVGAPIWLPVLGTVYAAGYEYGALSFRRAFNVNLQRMQKSLEKIPQSAATQTLRDFSAMAPKAYAFEEAAAAYVRAGEKEKKAASLLQAALPLVDEVIKQAGMNAEDGQRLKTDFLAGRFPAVDQYRHRLEELVLKADRQVKKARAERHLNPPKPE